MPRRRRRRRGRDDLRSFPQSGPGFSPPVNLIPKIDERGHLPGSSARRSAIAIECNTVYCMLLFFQISSSGDIDVVHE
ncbi:hypothetical protein DAI22_02g208700 [Oryza sativa Japonica Group]|nr:hypothetical protein DAI22_02g208700 [Oryza sativa Japonica Group]